VKESFPLIIYYSDTLIKNVKTEKRGSPKTGFSLFLQIVFQANNFLTGFEFSLPFQPFFCPHYPLPSQIL
jgi:hypothetical protein